MDIPSLMGHSYITPEGIFSQDQLLVAKMINDYDSTLNLVRVENPDKKDGQLDCAVVCTPHVGRPYVVFFVNQSDVNYRTYGRVLAADMQKAGASLGDILTANDQARQLYEAAKHEEAMAEKEEFAQAVLKSPLHTYKHNGKVYK